MSVCRPARCSVWAWDLRARPRSPRLRCSAEAEASSWRTPCCSPRPRRGRSRSSSSAAIASTRLHSRSRRDKSRRGSQPSPCPLAFVVEGRLHGIGARGIASLARPRRAGGDGVQSPWGGCSRGDARLGRARSRWRSWRPRLLISALTLHETVTISLAAGITRSPREFDWR